MSLEASIRTLNIYFPSCMLANEPDLLRITTKLGYIARFASIYRVNNIVIYESSSSRRCRKYARIAKTILEYARTPPYLKKRIFPKQTELQYVGLIPPLQLPTHNVGLVPVEGEIREAYIVRKRRSRIILDIGLPKLVEIDESEIPEPDSLVKNRSIIVKITSTDPLRVSIERGNVYTGYSVEYGDSLIETIKKIEKDYYVIGTSRKGRPVWKSIGSLLNGYIKYNGQVAVFFGEPYRGLFEIAFEEYNHSAESLFHDIFNFVPSQGTKTIRIEEAMPAVLQTLRLIESEYSLENR